MVGPIPGAHYTGQVESTLLLVSLDGHEKIVLEN